MRFLTKPRKCFAVIVAVVGLCTGTTGCYDRQELEQQAFVTALGVDEAPNDMIDCTFRFALPQNPTGGSGSGGDTPLAGKGPITFRAHTVTEALLIANSSVERQVTLTHLNHVLFGRKLAEKGLEPTLQSMVRYREFRPTILVGVANGTAREVIAAEKPMLDKSPSRMSESVAITAERTGLIPIAYLRSLQRIVENHESGGGLLPLFSVNKSVEEDPQGKQGVKGDGNVYDPGHVPRSGGNPVEWMGAMVFRGDKAVGELNGRQTLAMQYLLGQLRNTKLDFSDPFHPGKFVGLSIRREREPNYKVTFGNPLGIQVDVSLEGDVINMESGVDYSQTANRAKLEQEIQSQMTRDFDSLLDRLYHQYDADVIPISDHARSHFMTHQAFRSFPWADKLRDAAIRVNVQLHIRRYGVQITPL